MAKNPLMVPQRATSSTEDCPYGYGDAQVWCNWRNETMTRRDVRWIVAPSGVPVLVDDEDWSAANARADSDRKEAERKRYNWRQAHPVSEGN